MKSQKGFTLMELVASMGVFATLVLIASLMTTWAVARFLVVRDRLTAETLAYQAEVFFRNTLGQALDVEFSSGSVVTGIPTYTGRILHSTSSGNTANFVFDQMSDGAAWNALALFLREQSAGQGAGSRGQAVPTGIFYRRPTASTSGVLFFDLSTQEGSNAPMSPSYNDPFIDRVSFLSMTKHRHAVYDKVTTVDVRLKIRYHSNFVIGTTWCPAEDIRAGTSGCDRTTAWRDFDRSFSVPLRNNLMKLSGQMASSAVMSEERMFGNLYFLRLINSAGN